MYLNSKNYKQKYKKYKNKYQELQNYVDTLLPQKIPSLIGGDCYPLPNPEKEDMITTQSLLDLCPDAKGTFWCL
jgi:hypothetical protein